MAHQVHNPMLIPPADYAPKFWARVAVGSSDTCWPWLGKDITTHGYGRCHYAGHSVIASRVAFYLATGTNPTGMCVCHHCDNPICCNPSHLFLGTQSDNVRDSIRKGRQRHLRGAAHWTAKFKGTDKMKWKITDKRRLDPNVRARGEKQGSAIFSDDLIKVIRRWYSFGLTQMRIAEFFGCNRSTIGYIVRHKAWQHVV